MEIQAIKQRCGIIGNSPSLIRAIDIARQVAPTDLTVLITGESGTGKEVFPQIIHQLSARKHGPYIAVNCGAIPEGTIDSELFGHERGSFTGAVEARKGYFEEVNGGTIFLDEVAELPLSTQVRLLRVLESGEFLKVGSSKILKTNVRVVAATNVNVEQAISQGSDVFITGDVKYHDAQRALEAGLALIDIGHFASERIIVRPLAAFLRAQAAGRGEALEVFEASVERDPFQHVSLDATY